MLLVFQSLILRLLFCGIHWSRYRLKERHQWIIKKGLEKNILVGTFEKRRGWRLFSFQFEMNTLHVMDIVGGMSFILKRKV